MPKNYTLKQVTIGCLNDNVLDDTYISESINGKHFQVQQREVDKKSLKNIICVIDEENHNAVDIETGEYYHILKRDDYNRIVEKPGDIVANCYYALKVKENVKVTESRLYRIFLMRSVDKIMEEYRQIMSGKQVMKSIGEKK